MDDDRLDQNGEPLRADRDETPSRGRVRDAWPLLRETAVLLRRHGVRLCVLALVFILIPVAATTILAVPLAICQREGLDLAAAWVYARPVFSVLLAGLAGPLDGGYWLVVHRLLDGEKAGLRTLFAGYRRLWLFLNLAAVSAVVFGASEALGWVWPRLPWDFCWHYFDNLVHPDSPVARLIWSIPDVDWFLGKFHVWIQALLLLPIQWALAEVAIGGKTWTSALIDSVRLALRYRGPALLAFAVMVALGFSDWLRWLLPFEGDYSGLARSVVSWLNLAGNGAITVATTAIKATAFVVVYREFVWREREAGERDAP